MLNLNPTIMNRRLFAILCLGLASGLPLALTGSTLQAWFTQAGVNLSTIGALSLIGLPYTFKFLWAPFFDHYSFKFFGKRLGWIVLTQLGVIASLILLSNFDPKTMPAQMGLIAVMVAFFSASQDIGITAYQTDISKPEERGLGASYYTFGYRIAMLLSGGMALFFADQVGFKYTYYFMALMMSGCLLLTLFSPKPIETQHAPTLYKTVIESILDFMKKENLLMLLSFIVLYKFGDALALQLMSNFLLRTLHFSLTDVGLAFKIFGLIATILGGFVGGLTLTQLNIYRALLIFGLLQSFSNLMFVLLASVGKSYLLMVSAISIESFCSGLSTAALMAFLMSLCNKRYSASQYALLSALATAGRVLLGPLASMMVENLGWVQFYMWSFLLCFPSLILLVLLKNKVTTYAKVVTE